MYEIRPIKKLEREALMSMRSRGLATVGDWVLEVNGDIKMTGTKEQIIEWLERNEGFRKAFG